MSARIIRYFPNQVFGEIWTAVKPEVLLLLIIVCEKALNEQQLMFAALLS